MSADSPSYNYELPILIGKFDRRVCNNACTGIYSHLPRVWANPSPYSSSSQYFAPPLSRHRQSLATGVSVPVCQLSTHLGTFVAAVTCLVLRAQLSIGELLQRHEEDVGLERVDPAPRHGALVLANGAQKRLAWTDGALLQTVLQTVPTERVQTWQQLRVGEGVVADGTVKQVLPGGRPGLLVRRRHSVACPICRFATGVGHFVPDLARLCVVLCRVASRRSTNTVNLVASELSHLNLNSDD